MIKEAYVSFEIAKLLKEKGFDEECFGSYTETNHNITMFFGRIRNSEYGISMYTAPTHQTACAWLREVHTIDIEIRRSPNTMMYRCLVYKDTLVKYITDAIIETYEEAVESAIKYSLEKLI